MINPVRASGVPPPHGMHVAPASSTLQPFIEGDSAPPMNYSPAIYQAYQGYEDLASPVRAAAKAAAPLLDIPWPHLPELFATKNAWAACEVIALAGLTHQRVPFAIESIEYRGEEARVSE